MAKPRDKGRPPRILLAGGGTGGHVYPAIAIADAITALEPDAAIIFAGTRTRMEWDAVPKAGYTIFPISVTALYRELSLRTVTFPFKLARGLVESWSLVDDFDADVAVGTGGFVAGPVLLTASVRGRPIVIQEQNAYAGLTNRMLGKRASRIHLAFPEAERYFPGERTVLTGNPVRKELAAARRGDGAEFYDVPADAKVLLVFGGSLGSASINAAVEKHLLELLDPEDRVLIWQTGKGYYDDIRSRVSDHPRLRLLKYLDRMDLAYAVTDLAVCRAGAITCSELMLTGTPALLVPSPNVAEDHQTKNARSMTNAQAAELLVEENLEDRLVARVNDLMMDDGKRSAMETNAKKMARPDAATDIARDVLELAKQ